MQKKLIALTIAGLVSAPVWAQSNVTVYGIVDMGYKYLSDSSVSGVGGRHAIDSGQRSGSRLGFRGTEDLGNGLKASFVLESGIAADTGGLNQGGLAFGRQSYVALSGSYGTIAAGRQYNPQHLIFLRVDPFGQGTVGRNSNIWGLGSAAAYQSRLNNLVTYTSPSFSGFNLMTAWTWASNQNESVDNKFTGTTNDMRMLAINPNYVNGPIRLSLNYLQAKFASTGVGATSGRKFKVWDIAGTYDFGVAKLAAAYGVDNPEGGDNNTRKFMVGVTVPVLKAGKVLASYNQARHEDGDRASQWAVGYDHALSKRTTLYTAFADIDNRRATNEAFTAVSGDSTNAGMTYQRGFNLGVRHTF